MLVTTQLRKSYTDFSDYECTVPRGRSHGRTLAPVIYGKYNLRTGIIFSSTIIIGKNFFQGAIRHAIWKSIQLFCIVSRMQNVSSRRVAFVVLSQMTTNDIIITNSFATYRKNRLSYGV